MTTTDLALPQVVPSGAYFEGPDADGLGRIVVDRPDDPVNALNPALIEALAAAIEAAGRQPGLRGLLIVSGKPEQWIAGADLDLLTAASAPEQVEAASRRLQAVFNALAALPVTTVAAINGPALGGGLELALACDYRVAADAPGVAIGLPEVSLGLVPAGGGTVRLPRLVGLAKALDLILSARRLNARRARREGLVDEVVHPAVLEQAARTWAAKPKRSGAGSLKLGVSVDAALDLAERTPAGRRLLYNQARQGVLGRVGTHYPAPLRALEVIQAGQEGGVEAGLAAEARAFAELAWGDVARNLIWLFLATTRQKRQQVSADPAQAPRPVERLGVVGAGFMGAGIAEVAAVAGLSVRVRDVKPEAVAKGLASIKALVDEAVAKRRFDAREGRAILNRVSGTTDYSGFARADLVVEAVYESLELKRRVVAELEAVVRPDVVIASNTSALPIREIAAGARHPERIVGMHFFSPVHRMPLLEVVRPAGASEQAVATAVAAGQRLGKTVIVVGDGPGFYTTRVLGVMLNEAALLLGEGASVEAVDAAMTAFGFPVGPFTLMDEVGLEVAQHVGETLAAAFGERQPVARIVPDLVAQGRTGKRGGRGFYTYAAGSGPQLPGPLKVVARRQPARRVDPAVYASLGRGVPAPGSSALPAEAIQARLVLLFVNEAARCLGEGVLRSPVDGDLGAVLGLGFPPFLGGPFRWADRTGLERVVAELRRFAERHGRRYEPAAILVETAQGAGRFYRS